LYLNPTFYEGCQVLFYFFLPQLFLLIKPHLLHTGACDLTFLSML
jgi:hypothetical protein